MLTDTELKVEELKRHPPEGEDHLESTSIDLKDGTMWMWHDFNGWI